MPLAAWQRRGSARTLVKLLAVEPSHRLHREQILELLWPDVEPCSALNRFGKALHAARRALEPDLAPRAHSAYLHLPDDLLILDTDLVQIDTDTFERSANAAFAAETLSAYEEAATAYSGDLLPEDRYEDWTIERREALSSLHQHVLAGLAEALYQLGQVNRAEAAWQRVLVLEPAHESIHRSLMRLYTARGDRALALRQYHECQTVLQEELGTEPEPETMALHEDILAGVFSPEPKRLCVEEQPATVLLPTVLQHMPAAHLIGLDGAIATVRDDFDAAERGNGHVVLLSGEPGTGKTRLMADLAREAAQRGHIVLWGASYTRDQHIPYSPFIEALEGYMASLAPAGRETLMADYPLLSALIPSLIPGTEIPSAIDPELWRGRLIAEFAGLLAGLAHARPVLLALDDLHLADTGTLHLLQLLARGAGNHHLLIIGAYRDEEIAAGSDVFHLVTALRRDALAHGITLGRLSLADAGSLIQACLGAGTAAPALLDHIHVLSLGNPLCLRELVPAMREDGSLENVDGVWQLSPHVGAPSRRCAGEVLGSHFDTFGSALRRFLTLAAVQGMQFCYPTLHAAARIAFSTFDDDEMLDAVDRALSAGILEDRGDIYCFAHPLIRDALLELLPTHRRLHFHRVVATAIEQHHPGDIQAIGYHYARSDSPERATPYLEHPGVGAPDLPAHDGAPVFNGAPAAPLDGVLRFDDAPQNRALDPSGERAESSSPGN